MSYKQATTLDFPGSHPTPHKKVIIIEITPWSKKCPHIFTGLGLPGGGLLICGDTRSKRGLFLL